MCVSFAPLFCNAKQHALSGPSRYLIIIKKQLRHSCSSWLCSFLRCCSFLGCCALFGRGLLWCCLFSRGSRLRVLGDATSLCFAQYLFRLGHSGSLFALANYTWILATLEELTVAGAFRLLAVLAFGFGLAVVAFLVAGAFLGAAALVAFLGAGAAAAAFFLGAASFLVSVF